MVTVDEMNRGEERVFEALTALLQKSESPTIDEIAHVARYSKRNVIRSLQRLGANGHIVIVKRGGRAKNEYRISQCTC